jgi:hypothetical protein
MAGPRAASLRRRAAVILVAVAFTGALVFVLAGRRAEFLQALNSAPLLVLAAAVALQALALVSRCEAWQICVNAAGGSVNRVPIYGAAAGGNLACQINPQLGAAARIGILRRLAPAAVPRLGALIAAEVPILTVEGLLAALTSFTLVGPLGLPWWLPLAFLAAAIAIVAGLRSLAGRRPRGACAGLAVLRQLKGRTRVIGFVLVAVVAQIARNWMMLRALGVDASVLDAIAVLIAMVTLSQLPIGPGAGTAAVVAILGTHGVALTAAAGVLLTATGTVGALCFAAVVALTRLTPKARFRARLPVPLVPLVPVAVE